jgi:hypothetical protein
MHYFYQSARTGGEESGLFRLGAATFCSGVGFSTESEGCLEGDPIWFPGVDGLSVGSGEISTSLAGGALEPGVFSGIDFGLAEFPESGNGVGK